jgi:hypothetical protein
VLGTLRVEGDFDQGGQAVTQRRAQFVGVQHSDLPFYPALVGQSLHATQAGGRRNFQALGQGHVAEGGVVLQGVEQLEIGLV